MQISEVLRILQEYQEEYGDIDVMIEDEWGAFNVNSLYVEKSMYDETMQLVFAT